MLYKILVLYLFPFTWVLIGLLDGGFMRSLRDFKSLFVSKYLSTNFYLECGGAGTPRIAEHIFKPTRSSMNTTTTRAR